MANEFQLLPNPDNVPGAVTSGYQRQNTNIFTIQTGLDTTEPVDNGSGVITIPLGGIVEVNGVLFKLTSDIKLQKPNDSTCYWIAINPNDDGIASASLVTRPGKWNSVKQGCYLQDGRRTLNWVSLGTPQNLTELSIFSKTLKGKYEVQLGRGWYYVMLTSGLGGTNGGNHSGHTGGGGGVASVYDSLNKVFFSINKIYDIKIGGNGFNGGNGGSGHNFLYAGGGGGSGGGERSSFDRFSTSDIKSGDGGRGNGGYGGTYGRSGDGATVAGLGPFSGGGGGGGAIIYMGGGDGPALSNNGGGGGLFGFYRADGEAGGYCNIYKLEF